MNITLNPLQNQGQAKAKSPIPKIQIDFETLKSLPSLESEEDSLLPELQEPMKSNSANVLFPIPSPTASIFTNNRLTFEFSKLQLRRLHS